MLARKGFEWLENATPSELEHRRREIIASASGDYRSLDDDTLAELAAITQALRRQSSGPPRQKKDKTPPTINDLL